LFWYFWNVNGSRSSTLMMTASIACVCAKSQCTAVIFSAAIAAETTTAGERRFCMAVYM
jgi:hypothetical protein